DLRQVFEHLYRFRDASNVLVEAGPTLTGSLLDADLVDEALVYVAPLLLGDEQALAPAVGHAAPRIADARRFQLVRASRLGPDAVLRYRRERNAT
ncbi:MAG: dihydrofolate reductase family protein, partial [Phycisphaerales bacterium]|nr:dihydrofolate reductase family protein [Phycisphaerales bacterium]